MSSDGSRWIACKLGFLLHVWVLSCLFRRAFLDGLLALHREGELTFHRDHERLAQTDLLVYWFVPFLKSEWVVYAKPPL